MHHNVEVRYNSTVPKDLKVSNGKSEGSDWLHLPGTYTKKYFLVDHDDIAIPSKFGKWKDFEESSQILMKRMIFQLDCSNHRLERLRGLLIR